MTSISKKDLKYFLLATLPVLFIIFASSNIYAFSEIRKKELEEKSYTILNTIIEKENKRKEEIKNKIETLKKLEKVRSEKANYFKQKIIEAQAKLARLNNQRVVINTPQKKISFKTNPNIKKIIPSKTTPIVKKETSVKRTRRTMAS